MAKMRTNSERKREREREVFGENSKKMYFTSLIKIQLIKTIYIV